MRRMVTNERQRLYALETRKNQAAAKQAKNKLDKGHATPSADIPQVNDPLEALSNPLGSQIDPKLNQYHYSIEPPASHSQELDAPTLARIGMRSVFAKKAAEYEGPKYHVSIMQDGHRVMPRFTLTPINCPNFASLIQHINSVLDDDGLKVGTTKVMGPDGLADVVDENSWKGVIELISRHEWMDEEVRCIVYVE
jgi:hypothetical protein